MSIVTVSTIWRQVCPVTAADGLVTRTTQTFPPNFTPTATQNAIILASSAAAMSVIDGSAVPTGTLPPADTFGVGGGPRLTVAVPIHTTLIVDVFPNPIPTPIQTYRPGWDSTGDGSLITPVYQAAAKHDHARILLMGALLAIFVRNVFVAIDYLRRGRARDKTLFYLLLASQLWGPVAFSAIIAGILSRTASCTVINIITVVAMEVSSSLLVTGILGIKAYRCLNRSKIVLFITWALQVASIVLFLLDLVRTSSVRAFNGTCAMNNDAAEFIPAWISVMFSETGFLSLCFLLAAWKSSKSPAAQGRLSLVLSQPGTESHISIEGFPVEDEAGRRGWWDYVPTASSGPHVTFGKPPPAMDQLSPLERVQSGDSNTPILLNGTPQPRETIRRGVRQYLVQLFSSLRRNPPQNSYPRKPSDLGPYPLPQPPREAFPPSREKASPLSRSPLVRFTPDHTDTVETRWSKRLPNMLRSVIRNELFYTTAITFSCVVSAIIVSSAARSNLLFDPLVWLQINWAVTSWLVMRSYDQVIQRHEREKILQEPFIHGNAAVADVTRPSYWRDRHSVSTTLSSRSSWRNGRSLDDDRLGHTHTHRRQPTVLSNNTMLGIAREYSNPFHDFQSVVTHEPSRENDGIPSRPRPDSVGTGEDLVRDGIPPPAWSDIHRPIGVQEDPRMRPPLPRLETTSPQLPALTFEFTSASPLSESPPRAPRRGRPPGGERTSAESPIAVTSSTNLRSPTTVSFDHSVSTSDPVGITRRSRSHDWGSQQNP